MNTKYERFWCIVDEYNSSMGKKHTIGFIEKCAEIIDAELDWDGWSIRGFGTSNGYYPA